ncbi:MAG: hypothetical protein QXH92_04550 [Candidatus Aenigmatarchaeota archaeon]
MARLGDYFDKNYVIDASYDSATNSVNLLLAHQIDLDEEALKLMVIGLDMGARNKRKNLRWPISEKENPDFSAIVPKLRVDADGQTSETQIEYRPQFVLWLKYPDLRYLQIVNPIT